MSPTIDYLVIIVASHTCTGNYMATDGNLPGTRNLTSNRKKTSVNYDKELFQNRLAKSF